MIDHLAIIGLGSIGRRHLRLAREFRSELKITAIRSDSVKVVPEENIADNVVYTMNEAIESGIQAAVIATPAVLHLGQVRELVQAGIHILVEKPLSDTMEGVNELIKTQKESGLVGLVGYCFRYDPAALKFRELLNNDKTGQILHVTVDCGSYLPDWRPGENYKKSVSAKNKLGGGVLLELSHELDYIRWFFGAIKNVHASLNTSGTLDIEVEDSADMILESVLGFNIAVHLDFNSRSIRRSCRARCTKGDLVWDAVAQKVNWHPVDNLEEEESLGHDRDYIYREQLQHFFACIEKDQTPVVTLDDGAKVLHIVEAARESSAKSKTVSL